MRAIVLPELARQLCVASARFHIELAAADAPLLPITTGSTGGDAWALLAARAPALLLQAYLATLVTCTMAACFIEPGGNELSGAFAQLQRCPRVLRPLRRFSEGVVAALRAVLLGRKTLDPSFLLAVIPGCVAIEASRGLANFDPFRGCENVLVVLAVTLVATACNCKSTPLFSLGAQLRRLGLTPRQRLVAAAMECVARQPTTEDTLATAAAALRSCMADPAAVVAIFVGSFAPPAEGAESSLSRAAAPALAGLALDVDPPCSPGDDGSVGEGILSADAAAAIRISLEALLRQSFSASSDSASSTTGAALPTIAGGDGAPPAATASAKTAVELVCGAARDHGLAVASADLPKGSASFADWTLISQHLGKDAMEGCQLLTCALLAGSKVVGFATVVARLRRSADIALAVDSLGDFCAVAGGVLAQQRGAEALAGRRATEAQLQLQRQFVSAVTHECAAARPPP